nr:precorrin-3B synthase [Paraburkholderia phymatum]
MRPSACPGLLRIVPALDGGICRVKLQRGELSATQALAIADAIDEHASGIVDLTNRANLQLRGVKRGHENALIAALLGAALGPRDAAHAHADDVRNVMTSPAAGCDAHALYDTTALAAELLSLLQSDARCAALSPKFALLLDGGERLMMLDHPHDIWCSALHPRDHAEPMFALGLAGCPPVLEGHPAALAAVPASELVALTRALLHTFLDLAAPDHTRMRDLLAKQSVESVLARAERESGVRLLRGQSIQSWRREPADASRRFGAWQQRDAHRDKQRWHIGGQPALGRVNSATLRRLALLTKEQGATLRMTPWQSVLLTDIGTANLDATLQTLDALGLATTTDNPLTRVIACAGSTGCVKSLADTKADAVKLAARLPDNTRVHLSGCPRSCAAAQCAPFTMLAAQNGRYDLYHTHDPRESTGFGRLLARGLTIDEAADLLNASAAPPFDEPFDA